MTFATELLSSCFAQYGRDSFPVGSTLRLLTGNLILLCPAGTIVIMAYEALSYEFMS